MVFLIKSNSKKETHMAEDEESHQWAPLAQAILKPSRIVMSMLADTLTVQRALLEFLDQHGQLHRQEFEAFLVSFRRQHREQIHEELRSEFRAAHASQPHE